MSGTNDNLVLEHLLHIRAALDEMRTDMRDVEMGPRPLQSQLVILQAQYAHVSSRIDRLRERVEHIERRIGLVDA
jgi:hypothetical protein